MRSFIAIIAVGILTLSQSAFALPEPVGGRVSPNDKHAGLMKRATNCGMNEHDESMCPEGAECNCAIQNPVSPLQLELLNTSFPFPISAVPSNDKDSTAN